MASKKLVRKLTILAIVPVIISMILIGGISYAIYKDQLIHQRINEATSLIVLSSEEIKNPLYFIQLDKLNIIIGNIKKNPNVIAVYIMDPEGRIITDGTPENKLYNQTLKDVIGERTEKSGELMVHIGKDVLHISAPVVVTEKIGTIRIDFSLKEMNDVLLNMIVLLGVIGTIVIILIAAINFSFSNSISKPITELRDVAGEIAKGNFNRKIKINSDDEIGELTIAFNKMAADLQESIAERRRTEEIRRENERLELAGKAKAEFLTTMSHELRTPMNSVIGFSELLKRKAPGELNEKQEHYIDNVLTSSRHLLRLIDDILEISKVEAGKIELLVEKISIDRIIDDSLILVEEKAASHNILIKKELDPGLDYIEADKQKIKQILFNLLSNAVKFSKNGGGTITIATKKEGNMAKISVSDTGIGIKEQDMGRLFKEFEQLDSGISRKYGGTGLGLAITKKLVELHGGKICVESKYGEGTAFTFFLPVVINPGEMP